MIKAIFVELIWRGLSLGAQAIINYFKREKKEKEVKKKAEKYEESSGKDSARDTFGGMP